MRRGKKRCVCGEWEGGGEVILNIFGCRENVNALKLV